MDAKRRSRQKNAREQLPPAQLNDSVARAKLNDWLDRGASLLSLRDGLQWELGDWIIEGHEQFSRAWAVDKLIQDHLSDYTYGTLANFAMVCRKFPKTCQRCDHPIEYRKEFKMWVHVTATSKHDAFSWRHEKLTFSHHYEVHHLEPAEAQKLLNHAAKHKLSSKALRALINQSNIDQTGTGSAVSRLNPYRASRSLCRQFDADIPKEGLEKMDDTKAREWFDQVDPIWERRNKLVAAKPWLLKEKTAKPVRAVPPPPPPP